MYAVSGLHSYDLFVQLLMCILCSWCAAVLNFNRPFLPLNWHFIVSTGQNHHKFKKKYQKIQS